ncbi:MAG: chromate transporter [Oscillospiraceae bacterium]|nr:chromate transporter [Oscillospiraceae bacterium]
MYEFFCTGLFAIGGGLATIPFLQSIGRRRPGWYTSAQLGNMIAASQCAPGPLGTNMATFVGFTVGGWAGALLSVLALMAPTVLVDLAVAHVMERFRGAEKVEKVMEYLRPVSAGLICAAAFALLQISLGSGAWNWRAPATWPRWFNWPCCALYAALLPFALWKKLKKIHPIAYIAAGAAVGMLFKF